MSEETIPEGGAVPGTDTDESLASAAFGEDQGTQAAEPANDEPGDTSGDADEGAAGSIESLDQLAEALGTSV